MKLTRGRGGVVNVEVSEVEGALLSVGLSQLLELLGEPDTVDDDPLAAMVGLPGGAVQRPDDPALARLLPDAYRPDASSEQDFDADEAAAEFRRYTEADLRAGKRAQAQLMRETLGAGRHRLDRDQADAWLGALNDLRLVLGTRLEVTEDTDDLPLPEDSDRAQALHVYGWVGWVQESLLRCMEPRSR